MTHTVAPRRARTVAAVLLAVVITSGVVQACGGDDAEATSFERQPADAETPNPFMEGINTAPGSQTVGDPVASTSTTSTTAPAEPATTTAPVTLPAGANSTVAGDTPGLYGGSQNKAVCDATKMAAFLKGHPDEAAAWAGVLGIKTADIENYIALLTPTTLRTDTAVTNHGFKNGKATTVPAVLQAGTAVFVNDRGVPVVKCNCGNPLTPPASRSNATFSGSSWKGFSPRSVATVRRSPDRLNDVVLVNITNNTAFTRPVGTDGDADVPYVREPEDPTGRPDDGEGATTTTAGDEATTTSTTVADDTTTTTTTAPTGEEIVINVSTNGTGGDCAGVPGAAFEIRVVGGTIIFTTNDQGPIAADGTFDFTLTGAIDGAPGSTSTRRYSGRLDQGPPWGFNATSEITVTSPTGMTSTCISTYTGTRRDVPAEPTTTTSTTTTTTLPSRPRRRPSHRSRPSRRGTSTDRSPRSTTAARRSASPSSAANRTSASGSATRSTATTPSRSSAARPARSRSAPRTGSTASSSPPAPTRCR